MPAISLCSLKNRSRRAKTDTLQLVPRPTDLPIGSRDRSPWRNLPSSDDYRSMYERPHGWLTVFSAPQPVDLVVYDVEDKHLAAVSIDEFEEFPVLESVLEGLDLAFALYLQKLLGYFDEPPHDNLGSKGYSRLLGDVEGRSFVLRLRQRLFPHVFLGRSIAWAV